MTIRRLLIANRGEIACRIMRTCRSLGIESVAIFSDADRDAQHVRLADFAYPVGPPEPALSYLNIDAVLKAAVVAGADAIHPGYGFLSENAEFVRRSQEAGLIFVGPDVATIEQMGSKAQAKATMEAAGVPVVPGYHGANQQDDHLQEQAENTGYPLMIKAAAGGGGKGMRIVRSQGEFLAALHSARRESVGAFGDDRVILERYIERPRHLEVQVFGDRHGQIVHLFERDCSTQRRYQKIVEESPAPGLDSEQREGLCAAGVAAATAVNYVGAGTVEFIAGQDGEFFFMEMNTRLQVEHPVTEAVTGQDLVAWQLKVAAGEPLPLPQKDIRSTGHAIEARLYAEDPGNGFLPSIGKLQWLAFPTGCRVDTGVTQGDRVTVFYDPMLAKLIAHAADRTAAIHQLRRSLADTALAPVRCNLPFLSALLAAEVFVSGAMHTAFLDSSAQSLLPGDSPPDSALVAALIAQLLNQESMARHDQARTSDPHSPWASSDGWRLAHPGKRRLALDYRGTRLEADAWGHAGNYRIVSAAGEISVANARHQDHRLSWFADAQLHHANVALEASWIRVATQSHWCLFGSSDPFAVEFADGPADNRVIAPMPGRIVALNVDVGQQVEAGTELLIMEAMKMELSLKAPLAGKIVALPHGVGDFVDADALLVEIEPEDT